MDKIKNMYEIQGETGKFIKDLSPLLQDFLDEKEINFEIADIPTFAFDPFRKKVLIGKQQYEKLNNNSNDEELIIFFKMALFHEISHFRDLKVELTRNGKASMKKLLKEMSKKIIKTKQGEIPIGEAIHRLYNEIDDIVVNTEVLNYLNVDISPKQLEHIYKTILFPYYDKDGNLILEGDIDYSNNMLSTQFGDFLLRSFMVPEQKIILNKDLSNIIKAPNINTVYKRLFAFIEEKEKEYRNSNNQALKKRYELVKDVLLEKKVNIKNFNIINYDKIFTEISNILSKYGFREKFYLNWNIFDIIRIFTYTKGKDENHHLIVSPNIRYEIIKNVFEPIQEILILLDFIENGEINNHNKNMVEGNNPKGETKEGKSNDQEGQEGENKEWENQEGENQEGENSGQGGVYHDDMNIEEKIKILDELERQDIEKEVSKKEKEIKRQLNNVFNNEGIDPKTIQIINRMLVRYTEDIKELVDFFVEQLKSLEKQLKETVEQAKKGKLDVKRLTKEIIKDPVNPDLSKSLYNIIDIKEKLEEEFKEMDFIFVIDISSSMNFQKGEHGALSIITLIFSETLMHLEKYIQNMIEDPNYKINLDFILYGDDIGYSTLGNESIEGKPSRVKFAKVFKEIQRLTGGTNDRVGWQKVANELEIFLKNNPEYVEKVKNGKKKPVILQIADTDVSEDGVNVVRNMLRKIALPENSFSIKRLILGRIEEIDYSFNWRDMKLEDGKIVKRQEFVWDKSEIIKKIKSLFENFIYEYVGDKN